MKRALMVGAAVVVLAGGALFGAREVSAGGGCHSTTMTDKAGVSVDLTSRCFEPTVIRVQTGDTVTWTNQDPDAHTVTGVAQSWGTYDELALGDSVSYEFNQTGVFPYFCVLHPSMVGAVVVGDGTVSATAVGEGAKLVSAVAPVAVSDQGQSTADSPAASDDDGNGVAVTLVVGAVLAAGLIGTSAGVAIARRGKAPTS